MKITSLLKALTYPMTLGLATAFALAALAVALISQYVFLLHPCELCLLQRYPYAAIVAVGIAGLTLTRNSRIHKHLTLLTALLLLTNVGIAGYHSGVEMDIFQGPDTCSASQKGEQTLEEMRAAILNAPLVSCKQAMAYFLGLSMATWNLIAAGTVASWVLWRWNVVRRKTL